MVLVLLIWSGFSLTVRAIGASPLTIADVALIRFSVPLLLLLPFLKKNWSNIKKARCSDILFILLGGIPFLFCASWGAQHAPTAYVGTIIAGTPPLFVALLSYFFYGVRISRKRALSLSLILLGVFAMIFAQESKLSAEMRQGIAFLISASIIWAGYTMGIKRANLNAISIATLISFLSFFITLALMITGVVDTHWGTFTVQQALPFIAVQGVGVGVLATLGFSYAVSQLGTARSSILGSLSPVFTALLAVPVFGEPLSMAILTGIAFTTTGVILSNRYS